MNADSFISNLISFGFKEFPVAEHERQDKNWQFKVKDRYGIKFFVQVRFWRLSRYSTESTKIGDSFDAWCQYDMNGPHTFNLSLNSVDNMSPREIVDWFNNVFERLNCTYYERFDDNEN